MHLSLSFDRRFTVERAFLTPYSTCLLPIATQRGFVSERRTNCATKSRVAESQEKVMFNNGRARDRLSRGTFSLTPFPSFRTFVTSSTSMLPKSKAGSPKKSYLADDQSLRYLSVGVMQLPFNLSVNHDLWVSNQSGVYSDVSALHDATLRVKSDQRLRLMNDWMLINLAFSWKEGNRHV